MFRSKWTRHNILNHLDNHHPDISYKLMSLKIHNRIQVGNFSHNLYGRLYAKKIMDRYIGGRTEKIVFETEHSGKPKHLKAFMNEWIKKSMKK